MLDHLCYNGLICFYCKRSQREHISTGTPGSSTVLFIRKWLIGQSLPDSAAGETFGKSSEGVTLGLKLSAKSSPLSRNETQSLFWLLVSVPSPGSVLSFLWPHLCSLQGSEFISFHFTATCSAPPPPHVPEHSPQVDCFTICSLHPQEKTHDSWLRLPSPLPHWKELTGRVISCLCGLSVSPVPSQEKGSLPCYPLLRKSALLPP